MGLGLLHPDIAMYAHYIPTDALKRRAGWEKSAGIIHFVQIILVRLVNNSNA